MPLKLTHLTMTWTLQIAFVILISGSATSYMEFTRRQTGTHKDVINLSHHLLNNYSDLVRPVYNQSQGIDVAVTVTLENLLNVDGVRQELEFIVTMELQWKDEFLVWDPADFGGVNRVIVPRDKVWTVNLSSSKSTENLGNPDASSGDLIVNSNGTVVSSSQERLKIACSMNMIRFPYDAHRCSIAFLARAYYESEVRFTPVNGHLQPKGFEASSEFKVTGFMALNSSEASSQGSISIVVMKLNVTRSASNSRYMVLIPVCFVVAIACVPYMLPPESEKKADIQMSVVLTYAVFILVLSGYIPPSETVPIVERYVVIVMDMNVFGLVIGALFARRMKLAKRSPPKCMIKMCRKIRGCHPMRIPLPSHLKNEGKKNKKLLKNKVSPPIAHSTIIDLDSNQMNGPATLIPGEFSPSLELTPEQEQEQAREEWKFIARVFDRFYFWIMLLAFLPVVVVFLMDSDILSN